MPAQSSPSKTYLLQAQTRLTALRRQIPALTAIGEEIAAHMLAGGNLFTPRIATWFPSEFGGRAGGLMGLKWANHEPTSKHDVAYFTLPDPRFWNPAEDKEFQRIIKSKANLFIVGAPDELPREYRSRVSAFTGGAPADLGSHHFESLKPLASFRNLEQFVRMWTTAGEMIAACTRAGKMPTVYMSVWLEGGFARNASFMKHNNLREPWHTPFFHEDRYIPPLAPGRVATEFLEELAKIHHVLLQQTDRLARAGQWFAQAHRSQHTLYAVAVGHSHPEILELKRIPNYPITWSHSVSDLNKAVPATLKKNDVALHLGYSPVDLNDVAKILRRGIKFIYTTPFLRPAALKDHPNLLWLDLPWRPADATVDIPGYGVRILPLSSSTHALTYHALLTEFATQMHWD